jgi:hypothetical protein
MKFNGEMNNLTDSKELHSYFKNNTTEEISLNNPLIKKGISCGYDNINNDVFYTFHQLDNSFTISYNEKSNSFVSFYDYKPSMYINRSDAFITTNPLNNKLYLQYNGDYNKFYDVVYPSNVTLLVNPEADLDTVLNNIMYKSEIYLNDIDQPDKTLTEVQLYNEYQNSGLVFLEVGRNKNLRRKFRDWEATLPRNGGTRQRIRNPWIFLKLQLTNNNNYKMILHDVVVSYSI